MPIPTISHDPGYSAVPRPRVPGAYRSAALLILALSWGLGCRSDVELESDPPDAGGADATPLPRMTSDRYPMIGPELGHLESDYYGGPEVSLACSPDVCLLAWDGLGLRFDAETGVPLDEEPTPVWLAGPLTWNGDRFLSTVIGAIVEISPEDLATRRTDLALPDGDWTDSCASTATSESTLFVAQGRTNRGWTNRTYVFRGPDAEGLTLAWVLPVFGCSMAAVPGGVVLAGTAGDRGSVVPLRVDGWAGEPIALGEQVCVPEGRRPCRSDEVCGCGHVQDVQVQRRGEGWLASYYGLDSSWRLRLEDDSGRAPISRPEALDRPEESSAPYDMLLSDGVGLVIWRSPECYFGCGPHHVLDAFRLGPEGSVEWKGHSILGVADGSGTLAALAPQSSQRAWLAYNKRWHEPNLEGRSSTGRSAIVWREIQLREAPE